jgi:hypothetical protein
MNARLTPAGPPAWRVLNRDIRWHILDNWGRFLRAHPRRSTARCALARIVRDIRRRGQLTAEHFTACITAELRNGPPA